MEVSPPPWGFLGGEGGFCLWEEFVGFYKHEKNGEGEFWYNSLAMGWIGRS
jgi:hypothetical protein